MRWTMYKPSPTLFDGRFQLDLMFWIDDSQLQHHKRTVPRLMLAIRRSAPIVLCQALGRLVARAFYETEGLSGDTQEAQVGYRAPVEVGRQRRSTDRSRFLANWEMPDELEGHFSGRRGRDRLSCRFVTVF